MATTTLNLTVVEKRMLSAEEAAVYAGIPKKYFRLECPVQPVELRSGTRLYDKRDLDQWIDAVKTGNQASSRDDILGRL